MCEPNRFELIVNRKTYHSGDIIKMTADGVINPLFYNCYFYNFDEDKELELKITTSELEELCIQIQKILGKTWSEIKDDKGMRDLRLSMLDDYFGERYNSFNNLPLRKIKDED